MIASRAWRGLLVACALVSVAPLYAARHLPFTDLPEHVAAMSTLRHWFDPAWPDAHIYVLSSRGSPYLAYHLLGALLTVVTGDALRANLVLMTVVGLAIPLAARSLLVATGGDERLALFSCTALWCRPLALGFLPFMAAVPATLFTLALVVRQVRAPTRRRGIALALWSLLIFYLHLDPLVLVVAVAAVLSLLPAAGGAAETLARRVRSLPWRMAWLAPTAIAAAVWIARSYGTAGDQFMGAGRVRFGSLAHLADEFPVWTQGIWRSPAGAVAGVALWGLLVLLAVHTRVPESEGVWGLVSRLVPFACALVLFAFLPFQVGITQMLNVRLAVFLLPCLLLLPRPDPGKMTDAVLVAVAVVVGAVAVDAAVQIHRAERDEIAGVDDLLALVTPGSRLLTLDFETRSAHVAVGPWIHLGALHRLRGGGVASVSFSDVPHWPLAFRPEWRPPGDPARSLEWHACKFRNTLDGVYYDHVLVRGHVDPFHDTPPGPRWRLAGRAGDWSLFSKLPGPDVPTTSPDDGPCPRLRALGT